MNAIQVEAIEMEGQSLGQVYIPVSLDLRQARANFDNFASSLQGKGLRVKIAIDSNVLRQLQQIKIDPSTFQAASSALKGIASNFRSITNDLNRAAAALKAAGGAPSGATAQADIAAAKAQLANLKAINQEIRNQQQQQKLAQQQAISAPRQQRANAQAGAAQIGAQVQAGKLSQQQAIAPSQQQKAVAQAELAQIRLQGAQARQAAAAARAAQPPGIAQQAAQKIQGVFAGGSGGSANNAAMGVIGQALGTAAGGIIGSVVGQAIGAAVGALGSTIGGASAQEQTMIRLQSLTGSSSEAGKALDNLKGFSDRLGIRLNLLEGAAGGLVKAFVDFRAATNGTNLQAGSDRYFQSFAKGFSAEGTTGEAQKGAFRAIAQMIGKGQLYSEEVYGQLAEASSNAPKLLSRGLGMTQRQMRAQMEAGNLTADVAIPRLAQQYEATSKVGSALYAQSFEASQNRFGNKLDELATNIGEVLMPLAKLGVELGTTIVNVVNMGVEMIKLPFDALGKAFDFLIGKTETTEQAKGLSDAVKASNGITFEEGVARDMAGLANFTQGLPLLGDAIRGLQLKKESDNTKGYRDTIATSQQIRQMGSTQSSMDSLAKIQQIDEQIAQLKTQSATLDPLTNSEDEFRTIAAKTDALNRQREAVNVNVAANQELMIQAEDTLKLQEDALAKKEQEGKLTGSEKTALQNIRAERESIAKLQDTYNKSLSSSIQKSEMLVRSMQQQVALQADQRAALDRSITSATYAASQANLNATPEMQQAINSGIAAGSSRSVIGLNQQQLAATQQQLADPKIQQLLGQMGFDGSNLEQLKQKIGRLDAKSGERKTLEAAIPLLESVQKLNDEIGKENQSLLNASIEARNRYKEVQKSVSDYFVNLADEVKDLELLVKEISAKLDDAPVKRELRATLGKLQGTLLGQFTEALSSIVDLVSEPLLAGIELEKQLQGIGRSNRQKMEEVAVLSRQQQGAIAGVNAAGNPGIQTGVGGAGVAAGDQESMILALLSTLESPTRQGRVDSATAIVNRVNATKVGEGDYGSTITEVAFAPGQFEPFFKYQRSQIQTFEDAIRVLMNDRGMSEDEARSTMQQTLNDLNNSSMIADSRNFIGGRTYFKGVSEYGNRVAGEDPLRQQGENFYHIGGGQNYAQLDRIRAANTASSYVSSQTQPRSTQSIGAGIATANGRTSLRLVRGSGTDEYGLARMRLQLIDGAGNVLDEAEANTGQARNQDFSQAASRNSAQGSMAPIPSGSYGLGAQETSTNQFGGQSGVGNWWVPIEGSGDNQQGRSAFGIHMDANRINAPGSAGCIVLARDEDKAKVAAWLQSTNQPDTLIVDYETIAGNAPQTGIGGINTGGATPGNPAPLRGDDLGQRLAPYQQAQTQYQQALQAQLASANADTQQRIATIIDQQGENIRQEQRKGEDQQLQRDRQLQDESIARTANPQVRDSKEKLVAYQRRIEDADREALRGQEDIDRQLAQQEKLAAVIQGSSGFSADQKAKLMALLGSYVGILQEQRSAVTQFAVDVRDSVKKDSEFQFAELSRQLVLDSDSAIASSRSQLQAAGVSTADAALVGQLEGLRQQFAATRKELTELITANEDLISSQALTAEQTAELEDKTQALNNQLEINNNAEERAAALLTQRTALEQRTNQANLQNSINQPYLDRVDLQAQILDRNYQSQPAVNLRRQARVSQIDSEFQSGVLRLEGQRIDLMSQRVTAEDADRVIANSRAELEQLRTLKLSQVNEEVKGFAQNLRDNLAGSIDGVVGSLSGLFKKMAEEKDLGQTLKDFAINSVQSIIDVFVKAGLSKVSESRLNGLFGKKEQGLNVAAGSAIAVGGLPGEQSLNINQFSPAASELSGSMISFVPAALNLASALAAASTETFAPIAELPPNLFGSALPALTPAPIASPMMSGGMAGFYDLGAAIVPKLGEIVANQQAQTGVLQQAGAQAGAANPNGFSAPQMSSGGGGGLLQTGLGLLGSASGLFGGSTGQILGAVSNIGQQVTSYASQSQSTPRSQPSRSGGGGGDFRFNFESVNVGGLDVISTGQLERAQSSVNSQTRRSPVFRSSQGVGGN